MPMTSKKVSAMGGGEPRRPPPIAGAALPHRPPLRALSPWEEVTGIVTRVERESVTVSFTRSVTVPIDRAQLLGFKKSLTEGRRVSILLLDDGRIRVKGEGRPNRKVES